jgi:hypothetical protein
MVVRNGRVVLTVGADKPYKVVFEHVPAGSSEHPVATVREGEALIRERLPGAASPAAAEEWHI